MSQPEATQDTPAVYPYSIEIPTRAVDLDMNGHVNQAVYYSFYETLLVTYLSEVCDFESNRDDHMIFCAENGCRYRRELSFPQLVRAALRVGHIGNSSVRFEMALFTPGQEEPAATGFFAIVFVDKQSRRPTPIPVPVRQQLELLRN
jgi:acyl-CoA thioester hydrolase